MNPLHWVITALSITGVILNIQKSPLGFVIWIITNTSWMIIDWRKRIYAQAALFFVYLILSIYGLISWME